MANFVKYNFDLEPALKCYNKVYKLKGDRFIIPNISIKIL